MVVAAALVVAAATGGGPPQSAPGPPFFDGPFYVGLSPVAPLYPPPPPLSPPGPPPGPPPCPPAYGDAAPFFYPVVFYDSSFFALPFAIAAANPPVS